ncbi:MAG: alanine/glycine:cation symporter family protein [Actinomycetaceae bacterium]|nr:alanine/glycine:cation symporter family protein [Actinomycetaceae bacterium]
MNAAILTLAQLPAQADTGFFATVNQVFTKILFTSVDFLYSWILLFLLIGVGLGLTIYLRGMQVTHARDIFTSLSGSRTSAMQGITSFQAFAVGVGTRIGIGNIGGVALALAVGGPGAIFWMWIVALLGMATSFAESVLAQLFKTPHGDGTFRGGPEYYMRAGLGWKVPAIIFAVISIVASGLAVPMVQINTVAKTFEANHGVDSFSTMIFVLLLLAPVILGGVKSVARASEYLAPFMAAFYILVTVAVIAMHPVQAWNALVWIVVSAFGYGPIAGGVLGGIFVALVNGARRGLFSNEAGLGTTPHAAGAATVAHPAQQGFVQSLGVFIDTIVVCTATALLILISGVYEPGIDPDAAGSLTATAVTTTLGSWMALPMSLVIFIFGYTSAYGAYSYGQVALDHLTENKFVSWGFRVVAVLVAAGGAVVSLPVAWALSDFLLGLGALVNLAALIGLAKWVRVVLQDWDEQRAKGNGITFKVADHPQLQERVSSGVW